MVDNTILMEVMVVKETQLVQYAQVTPATLSSLNLNQRELAYVAALTLKIAPLTKMKPGARKSFPTETTTVVAIEIDDQKTRTIYHLRMFRFAPYFDTG